jgi:hypothetical protein
MSAELNNAQSIPENLAAKALSTLARRFHGDTLADDLGLEHSPTASAVLNEAIGAVRSRRSRLRRDAAKWQAARETNLADTRQRLADTTDAPEYAAAH